VSVCSNHKTKYNLFICLSTFSRSSFFFFSESVAQNKFNRENPSNHHDAKKVGLKSGVDFEHFFFGQGGRGPGPLRSQLFFEVLGPTRDLSPTFFASR
jgi:hypothetical protein